jgi:hypothetical protein
MSPFTSTEPPDREPDAWLVEELISAGEWIYSYTRRTEPVLSALSDVRAIPLYRTRE